MPVNKIWVVAEAFEGKPLTVTLELLTAARSLGSTVEAFTWGGDTDSFAPELGKFGAAKVYTVGDIGQSLPGAAVGAAIAEQIKGGDTPVALLVPATYDGRDIAGRGQSGDGPPGGRRPVFGSGAGAVAGGGGGAGAAGVGPARAPARGGAGSPTIARGPAGARTVPKWDGAASGQPNLHTTKKE